MDPETQRLVNLLKVSLKVLGITNREVARRLDMSPSYISKLFSGASELRLDHVIRICKAASLEPAEFFLIAYPRQPPSASTAATMLRELLQAVQQPPFPTPKSAGSLGEEEMEKMLRATLTRLLGQASS